jgi:hypothetical protein
VKVTHGRSQDEGLRFFFLISRRYVVINFVVPGTETQNRRVQNMRGTFQPMESKMAVWGHATQFRQFRSLVCWRSHQILGFGSSILGEIDPHYKRRTAARGGSRSPIFMTRISNFGIIRPETLYLGCPYSDFTIYDIYQVPPVPHRRRESIRQV